MGVQHLWSILEPSKREEHIDKLRDKTLCIDLSLWICEAQGTKGLKDQLKPYLRTVFFRTLYLASLGVRPVFVLDGVPPEIKRETMVKRLQARGGHVATNKQKPRKLNRSRFTVMCNECCEMMGLLGIPFVKSDGEAEAMCAWLNKNNYADGVLTDDGDVFLYGAKVVYKDFNISSSKHSTDYLQVFRSEEIESGLGLTRRNMIALALLLGCDYLPAGVPGVGKETAIRLSSSLPGVDLLDRFHEWKTSPDVHPHDLTSLEVAIKRKAVKVQDFPNKAVIKEFLSPKVANTNINLRWRCPDLEGAKEFFFRKLDWPKEYTEEKMLILVTDWQLTHMDLPRSPLFVPARIVKPRVRQGKDYYEIEWNTKDGTSKWPNTFVNVKAKEIICRKFPTLADGFESELAAKKSKGKTKKSQKNKKASEEPRDLDDLLTKINSIDLNDDVKIVDHCSDDRTDKFDAGKKSQVAALSEKPRCEPHQDSENYEIKDDSLAGVLINCTGIFQRKPQNVESKGNEIRADFDRISPDEYTRILPGKGGKLHQDNVLQKSSKLSQDYIPGKSSDLFQEYAPQSTKSTRASAINVDSPPCVRPNFNVPTCDVFELADSLNSPAVNENAMFNLADMTVDQDFVGSDLRAVEDLLTDSFVASLQNSTPVYDSSPCHSNQRFRSLCGNVDNISFESNTISNENVSNFKDKIFSDSLQGLNETHSGEVSLFALDGLGDRKPSKNAKAKPLVPASDTPSSRERTSLASRLLKRFQTENCTNLADKLRSISGEGEQIYGDNEMNKSTKPFQCPAKQINSFAGDIFHKNGPFTDISNLAVETDETKSLRAKPNDVIVLD